MGTVLFVYAHPDDESFGIAGTAMKLKAEGHITGLLTLTREKVFFHLAIDRSGTIGSSGDLFG